MTSWTEPRDDVRPGLLSDKDIRLIAVCAVFFAAVLTYAVVSHQACMEWAAGDPERVKACEFR